MKDTPLTLFGAKWFIGANRPKWRGVIGMGDLIKYFSRPTSPIFGELVKKARETLRPVLNLEVSRAQLVPKDTAFLRTEIKRTVEYQLATGNSSHCVVYRGERFSERMAQRFELPAAPLRSVPRRHTRLMESMTAIVRVRQSYITPDPTPEIGANQK